MLALLHERAMSARLQSQMPALILDYVRVNALASGQHMPEQALADRFRVSRAPVRAALRTLAELGIVRSEPNRGFFLVKAGDDLAGAALGLAPDEEDAPYMAVAADRLAGSLPERVSENELMRRYRLSRGQVLKLLNRIAAEGWAERLPGHGWAFLPVLISREAYDQGYRFRAAMEPACLLEPTFRVEPAASRAAREQQMALLGGAAMRLTRAQLFQINADFHEMIVGWSGNPFFLEGLRRVNRVRRLIEYRITVNRGRLGRQCREHLQILDLLDAGDMPGAAAFLREHIDGARRIKTPAFD